MKKFLINYKYGISAIGLLGIILIAATLHVPRTFAESGAIDGVCGTADGVTFPYGTTGPGSYTLCSVGTVWGGFPSWTCHGNSDGSDASCSASIASPSPCNLPWGGTLANGSSITAYLSPYDPSCPSQMRTCSNGSLSGSYTNGTCAFSPPPTTLSASPTSVSPGGRATLTWSSSFATSCTAYGPWSNGGSLSGSGWTNALNTTTTFQFQCTGPGGASPLQSVTVAVVPLPTITFTASPVSVSPGNSTTLVWTSTGATSCSAVGGWSGSTAIAGAQVTGALSAGTHSYTINCSSSAGGVQSATVTVQSAVASSGGNLTGFAWSDTIGWLSFNSISDGSAFTYGVTMDTNTGALSGYAWSDNVGWVSFNAADVANCPF